MQRSDSLEKTRMLGKILNDAGKGLKAGGEGLEGVPGLPGAPQDEAGLTGKFETSHVGGAT